MADDQPTDFVDEAGDFEGAEGTFFDQTEGGVEEDDIDEKFSKLGSSSDDPEQKQRYREYVHLITEIEGQNKTLQELKDNILEICAKTCKTACDEKNIRDMRRCMEKENLKLQCLIQKAMQLQNFGSKRRWRDIPITTTFDEDNLKPYVSCSSPKKYAKPEPPCGKPEPERRMPCICEECFPKKTKSPKPPCSDSEDEEEQHIKTILCELKKMKITCPEDKMMVCEIVQALTKKIPPCSPCPSKPPKPHSSHRHQKSKPCPDDNHGDVVLEHLKEKVCSMQQAVEKINREIAKRQHKGHKYHDDEDEDCQPDVDAMIECGGKSNSKNSQIEKLKENYCYLLTEYSRKDAELKDLKSKTENKSSTSMARQSNQKQSNSEESELCILRARIGELKEEQQEFKCIMKEQSVQLEDYRNKYLSAQQKVEEQCVLLEKLNMNNKRIEKQINCEVKEIRNKFQEKLTELLHFPKLLENEQLKVAELNRIRDDLEHKLVLVCKELTAVKENQKPNDANKDLGPELAQCQTENEQLQKRICALESERNLFCEQLRNTQDDLDTLRSESAKIIARTKERTELIRQQQQECINKLEKELAQCRATACLSVSDREAVIREMQGQLNTLAFSFDAAQKQIKTLRNHIAYVSNENCYPVKCQ